MPKAIATGWYGRFDAAPSTSYSTTYDTSPLERKLRLQTNRSIGGRKLKKLIVALLGTAPGGSKAVSHTRVAAPTNGPGNVMINGGKVTIETKTDQSGVTTSGDVTRLTTQLNKASKPSSYPKDKSGFQPGKINSLIG